MESSDSQCPVRQAPCVAWPYHPCVRRFASITGGHVDDGPGDLLSGLPQHRYSFEWRTSGLPGSWGTPLCACPALRPRWDGSCQAVTACPYCLPPSKQRRLPRSGHFGAQSHGLHTRCLRFAAPVTRSPRKTRFRRVANLCRVGLVTHWVPPHNFRTDSLSIHPKRPSLPGAPRPVPVPTEGILWPQSKNRLEIDVHHGHIHARAGKIPLPSRAKSDANGWAITVDFRKQGVYFSYTVKRVCESERFSQRAPPSGECLPGSGARFLSVAGR